MDRFFLALALFLSGSFGSASSLEAQETEDEAGWTLSGELSVIATGGNAEAETLGFGLTAVRDRADDELSFALGGLRAESTTFSRIAVGTPDAFDVIETSDRDLTAENVYARGRYQHAIGERLFWFTGAGWERNEFAGFTSRLSVVGGAGRTWFENERSHFRADAGLTYTVQDDVIDGPDATDDFLGLRLGYDYARELTATTTFTSVLIVDQSLDASDDLRADLLNAIGVGINDLLSLKVSLHLVFDNLPALAEIPLSDPAGMDLGTVFAQLDDLDTKLTVGVVFTR